MENDGIKLRIGDYFFTWDDRKRQKNIEKHEGITFEMAAEIFFDSGMVVSDPYRRNGEWRRDTIGRPFDYEMILFVVITERVNFNGLDVIRIISARRADSDEKGDYYESQG
ncbi:MAG: BrnT family toxin, partial [Synergistaceae bacterium]|nr:BrnT family toxin [Synergistaceae bacterium]